MINPYFHPLRKLILGFSVLVISTKLVSQSDQKVQLDSLMSLINKSKDTSAINACLEVQKLYFFRGMFDSSLYYCDQGISLSERNKDYRMADLLISAGRCYYMKSINDSALLVLEKCKPFLSNQSDELIIGYNSVLASVYQDKGMTDSAIHIFLQSLPVLEKPENSKLKHLLFNTYANIGNIFLKEARYDQALNYYDKAMEYKRFAQNKVHIIMLYQKYHNIYTKTNELNKAEQVLDSSLALLKEVDNLEMKQTVLVNYGFLYEKKKEFKKAREYYLSGLQLTDSISNQFYRARILNNLSSVSIALNNHTDAARYAEKALVFAKQFSSFEDISYAYGNLKIIHQKSGQYKKALDYAELQHQYTDSARSTENQDKVTELEKKFENEKKGKEIAALKLLNTEKELAASRTNKIIWAGGIGALSLLVILGLSARSNQQRRIIAEKDRTLKNEQIRFLERQQKVVSLQSMINGQETERTRIARDLHDGLGGLFSTIKMYLSTLLHQRDELKADPLFSKSFEMINSASEEIRRIAHNMMPEVLIRLGLVQATRELCSSISAGKLLNVSLQSYGMDKRLNASTEVMLFRILQELLNNIIKHAQASEAIIQFNLDGNRLSITVEDNGKGFNLEENDGKSHAGFDSVESRVSYLNGKLSIDSQKEVGTTVMMDFLINEEA